MFDLLLGIFSWLGLLLGLFVVTIIWGVIIIFVVVEIRDLYREFRAPVPDDEYGERQDA